MTDESTRGDTLSSSSHIIVLTSSQRVHVAGCATGASMPNITLTFSYIYNEKRAMLVPLLIPEETGRRDEETTRGAKQITPRRARGRDDRRDEGRTPNGGAEMRRAGWHIGTEGGMNKVEFRHERRQGNERVTRGKKAKHAHMDNPLVALSVCKPPTPSEHHGPAES